MYATLAELKTMLGISDTSKDAVLTSSLVQASALITGYIGADLSDADTERTASGTLNKYAEFFDLPVWPLIDVLSVAIDDDITDYDSYTFDKRTGSVNFKSPVTGGGQIEVAYRAGFETIPTELNTVCLNLASTIYNRGGSLASVGAAGGALKSLTMFDAMSMSFDTGSAATETPQALVETWSFMLDQYCLKKPVLK